MIKNNPYKFTSDEVIYTVYCEKNNIDKKDTEKEREKFFSKGQPCFRSSPLPKCYGRGVRSNTEGKAALFAVESSEYKKLMKDKGVLHLKAMRSKKS